MATTCAIQLLQLKPGIAAEDFEALFETQILPAYANAPRSIVRGGRSAIASQHLLQLATGGNTYLWIIKASGIFSTEEFRHLVQAMNATTVATKLDPVCDREQMEVWTQVLGYDTGHRDPTGKATGEPITNVEL